MDVILFGLDYVINSVLAYLHFLHVHCLLISLNRYFVIWGSKHSRVFYNILNIHLRDSFPDSLSEEKLLEWRGVVQDLVEAKFNLSFLLEYLWSLAHMLFQMRISKDLDAEIVAAKEALAHAYKVLQDLKV